MCFNIPQKIIQVANRTITTEAGGTYTLPLGSHAKRGMYVRVYGEWVIDVLSPSEGACICTAITSAVTQQPTPTTNI